MILEKYSLNADNVTANVKIEKGKDFVNTYELSFLEFEKGTTALLNEIRERLISTVPIAAKEILDIKSMDSIREKFEKEAEKEVNRVLPGLKEDQKKYVVGSLIHEMLGLGELEILLSDTNLEEIVVNSAKDPVWVYHKNIGWLRSTLYLDSEAQILNYSNIIARRVGRQISTLTPLLDAHLITKDRANATLFPISSNGNTLTIRKFARDPWTIADFIENKTLNSEVAALIWLAIQYELNIMISGGTASGKTSLLSVCLPFIQPYHRIISIEDTRELQLPSFLHWVPMTTREPNPEGKGGVEMIDLLVNSLRMRPDRIVVGEIRKQREAEVLFEAMHTGHSVYSTLHADTAEQTLRRIANPPINIPETMLESIHLNLVMFRDRKQGIRRVFQVAEIVPSSKGEGEIKMTSSLLYRWKPVKDELMKHSESIRLYDVLQLHTRMSDVEINEDLRKKQQILDWIVANKVNKVDDVGKIIAEYYKDEDALYGLVEKNTPAKKILGK